ncbi:hypothetical protein BC829DRAFT_384614 [Chytridium lagenaria]|nr:hypothetical protein BC829DRAFT_384614 [Chytridium lagenaria]
MDIDELTCPQAKPDRDTELTKACVRSKTTDEESLAKMIEKVGFDIVWSHALARLYFLMYLMAHGLQELFFFRIETQKYRHGYQVMSTSARKCRHKIFITFLCRNAMSPLPWKPTAAIEAFVETVRKKIEAPDISLFDMLSYLSLQELENTFRGLGTEGDTGPENIEGYHSFKQSAFFQALRNDTRGSKSIMLSHINRAAERLIDMSSGLYPVDPDSLIGLLEASGLDCENYRMRLSMSTALGGLHRTTSRRVHGHTLRAKSLSSVSERRKTMDDASSYDFENLRHAYSTSSELSPHSHAFIAYIENDSKFCEYCFRVFKVNEEASNCAYRCETCGYVCHKNCRNSVHITCVRCSELSESAIPIFEERSKRLQDKINAIQKDIEIETKIQDGILRINSAKVALSTKAIKRRSELIPTELSQQVDISSRKLDALQQELYRCRLQLAAISATSATANAAVAVYSSNESVKTAVDSTTADEEVVRVTVMDRARLLFSPKTTTCQQLIYSTIGKFRLPGAEFDYNLTYVNATGDEVPLRYEDLLTHVDTSLNNGGFRVAPKMKSALSQGTVSEESLQQKQRDVIREIAETEKTYVFLQPLGKFGIVKPIQLSEIFSNVETISVLHEGIARKLSDLKDDAGSLVKSVVKIFEENVDHFSVYNEYCANQNVSRRSLLRLKGDNVFQKFVAQCEANPKLHKLALADYLVKPMHRITRYPIFFKRLLSLIPKTNPDFDVLNDLISKIEIRVASVNEAVRKQESTSKLLLIEENIDFSNVCEKFKIANGKRELISERNFHYYKKNASAPTEVTILLMSDMLLLTRLRKEQYVLYRQPIPLEHIFFMEQSNVTALNYSFQIVHMNVDSHTLVTSNMHERESWLHEAETARIHLSLRYLATERRIAEKIFHIHVDSIHTPFPPSFSSQDIRNDVTVKRASSWGHRSFGEISTSLSHGPSEGETSASSSMKRRTKSVEINLGSDLPIKKPVSPSPKRSGHPGLKGIFGFSSRRNEIHPKTPPTPSKTVQKVDSEKESDWVLSSLESLHM